jgi:hypothetical protein
MRNVLKRKKICALLLVLAIAISGASFGCNQITYTPRIINLVDGIITVPAGSNYDIPFLVDINTMKDVRIEGTFEVLDGSGNEIIIKIVDDMEHFNPEYGYRIKALYSFGRLNTSSIDVPITNSGAYHLVFSNMFSPNLKNVSAKFDLYFSEKSS